MMSNSLFEKLGTDLREMQNIPLNSYITDTCYDTKSKVVEDALELSEAFEFALDRSRLERQLGRIATFYQGICTTPFRDMNFKNVLVSLPKEQVPSFREFDGETLNHIRENNWQDLFENCIFHVDFSGWRYSVPPMDDWLMLGAQSLGARFLSEEARRLLFSNMSVDVLITAFVRYFRLVSRRFMYLAYSKDLYEVRYEGDPIDHYFELMLNVTRRLSEHFRFENLDAINELLNNMWTCVGRGLGSNEGKETVGRDRAFVYYDGFLG